MDKRRATVCDSLLTKPFDLSSWSYGKNTIVLGHLFLTVLEAGKSKIKALENLVSIKSLLVGF